MHLDLGSGATSGLSLDLPRDLTSARRARTATRRLLARSGFDPAALSDALVVVSELVTNAVVHGEGGVRLEVVVRRRHVEVSVCDEAEQNPVRRPPSTAAEGGRGMALVAALSTEWGVEPAPSGKRVWAHVSRS